MISIKAFFILIYTIITIIPLISVAAQTIPENSSDVESSDKNEELTSSILDNFNTIVTIIMSLFGTSGILFGYITHRKNEALKRQEIIFPLMDQFEESKKFKTAKLILDNFILDPNDPNYPERKNWGRKKFEIGIGGYYKKGNLNLILRIPNDKDKITDPGELYIRDSFDSLLDFFGRLGYLMHINIITAKEMIYFRYYIDRIRDDNSIICYVKEYKFELFALLLYKLKKHDERLDDLIKRYRLEDEYPTFIK